MKKEKIISTFEDYVAFGFGPSNTNKYSLVGFGTPETGYNMTPIAGLVSELCEYLAEEAYKFDSDDDPEHIGENFISEIKEYMYKTLEESYKKKTKK